MYAQHICGNTNPEDGPGLPPVSVDCTSAQSYPKVWQLDNSKYPMRTIRVSFHIIQDSLGNYNYPDNAATTALMQQLITEANYKLANNQRMKLPLGNTTPNLPIPFRYVLTPADKYPDNDGIYFYKNRRPDYFEPWNCDKRVDTDYFKTGKFNCKQNDDTTTLKIFLFYYHPKFTDTTQIISARGVAGTLYNLNCYTGAQTSMWGMHKHSLLNPNNNTAYIYANLLNHEVGHILGLRHSWSNDGLEDTPDNPNCWNLDPNKPGCDHPKFVSNNVMDYNADQSALTPMQLKVVNNQIFSYKGYIQGVSPDFDDAFSYIIPTGQHDTIYISRQQKGNITIKQGATLTIIGCNLYMNTGTKIIVENGARLTVDRGRIGSYHPTRYWAGIEVWGDPNTVQISATKVKNGYLDPQHGIVHLKGCEKRKAEISNARHAVFCNRRLPDGSIDWANPQGGGILVAEYADFKRNFCAVSLYPYSQKNKSELTNCRFTARTSGPNSSFAFVTSWENNGIALKNNIFGYYDGADYLRIQQYYLNTAKNKGIYFADCSFDIDSTNSFYTLAYAIHGFGGGLQNSLKVEKVKFYSNARSITGENMLNSHIIKNTFYGYNAAPTLNEIPSGSIPMDTSIKTYGVYFIKGEENYIGENQFLPSYIGPFVGDTLIRNDTLINPPNKTPGLAKKLTHGIIIKETPDGIRKTYVLQNNIIHTITGFRSENKNPGVRLNCNSFKSEFAIKIASNTTQGLATQGNLTEVPGDMFYQTNCNNGTIPRHIASNVPFQYYYVGKGNDPDRNCVSNLATLNYTKTAKAQDCDAKLDYPDKPCANRSDCINALTHHYAKADTAQARQVLGNLVNYYLSNGAAIEAAQAIEQFADEDLLQELCPTLIATYYQAQNYAAAQKWLSHYTRTDNHDPHYADLQYILLNARQQKRNEMQLQPDEMGVVKEIQAYTSSALALTLANKIMMLNELPVREHDLSNDQETQRNTPKPPLQKNTFGTPYPNPTKTALFVPINAQGDLYDEIGVVIQNLQGYTMQSYNIAPTNATLALDISTLPNGIYSLNLLINSEIYATKKIVIIK
jgi:hypothetical protein